MTFEEILVKTIKDHPTAPRIDLKDLPEQIEAKLVKYEQNKDQTGKDCVFLTFTTQKGELFTQKYGKSQWEHLEKTFKEAGGSDYLMSTFVMYEQDTIGRALNPRMFPTAKPKKGK
jgi:hypothetical protein